MHHRGAIGATIGTINTQLPYSYVHLIYWVTQLLMVFMALGTGEIIAFNMYAKQNGRNDIYNNES